MDACVQIHVDIAVDSILIVTRECFLCFWLWSPLECILSSYSFEWWSSVVLHFIMNSFTRVPTFINSYLLLFSCEPCFSPIGLHTLALLWVIQTEASCRLQVISRKRNQVFFKSRKLIYRFGSRRGWCALTYSTYNWFTSEKWVNNYYDHHRAWSFVN